MVRGDSGSYVASSDSLVPMAFGGWFRRVFGVLRRNCRELALLAAIPAVVTAVSMIVLIAFSPSAGEMQRRIDAASAPGAGDPTAAFSVFFDRMLPIMVVFTIFIFAAGVFYYAAAVFVVVRHANGQPSAMIDGVRFAKHRVLPLGGWIVLAALLLVLAMAIPTFPWSFFQVSPLLFVGRVVALLLMGFLGVSFVSSLLGVVVIERVGIMRCFGLIKRHFWSTFVRLLAAMLVYVVYGFVGSIVSWVVGLIGAGPVVGAVVNAALTVPGMMFAVPVCVVTYAELRFRENSATTTRSLAAELSRS